MTSSSSSPATGVLTRDTSLSSIPSLTNKPPKNPDEDNNNFSRHRPSYHVIAPTGWLNDPCAPAYDAKANLYRLFFQWNPDSHDWADIAWGAASSPDLLSWAVSRRPVLATDRDYDCRGVFTGCMLPGVVDDKSLTCAYTSVAALPIHHTLPHPRGVETLSLATSTDGGSSWVKSAANPILPGEPEGLDVTGWRDPFVASWPRMCNLLKRNKENTLFGIISGGIRDVTPTTFLYAIDRADIARWEYICPLVHLGLNFSPSRWSGDLGRNWEVTNFLTLKDEDDESAERDFLLMGTEGCIEREESTLSPPQPPPPSGPTRPARGQLWMSGSLTQGRDTPVSMQYGFGGRLDHGCFYAANSFLDPKTQRHIVYGWITEDDLCDDLRTRQGWSGLLSLPREIRMQTLHHVVKACRSDLSSITSIETEMDSRGLHTIRTLSFQPVESVVQGLRRGATVKKAQPSGSLTDVLFSRNDVRTKHWELDCSFQVSQMCRKIGIIVEHSLDSSKNTLLSFTPPTETFCIHRPSLQQPNSSSLINSSPETAPHTLFTRLDPATNKPETETLEMQVYRDNSVLEVFINGGRTAISTRLYAAEETYSIRFFLQDDDGSDHPELLVGPSSKVLSATLYDGIGIHAGVSFHGE